MTTRHTQMRNAINDVELALNGLEIDSVARLMEGADDSVMVKLPLGAVRQLAQCYPELNRIINDETFEKPDVGPAATPTREAAIKKIDEWTGEVLKRGFASSWHYGELADALAAPQAQEGRDAVIEECAKVLDACAQDWHRIRDPGMANNAKAYAKKIRALAAPVSRPDRGEGG